MNRFISIVLALATAGFAGLVAWGNPPEAKDSEKKSRAKEKKLTVFFTPYDQVLAQCLREQGKVETITVPPYKRPSSKAVLSDIHGLKDPILKPGKYYLESLFTSKDTSKSSAGYFSESLRLGAKISDIKNRGVFTARLARLSPRAKGDETDAPVQKFMACEATISPFSEK
jgi:hypothetical protein